MRRSCWAPALLLPELCRALRPWNDGQWYDAPQDFNVAIPICKVTAEAMPPRCPSEWQYFNGSCWTAIDRESEWREAKETCRETHDATLASIASAQENEVVQGICGQRMCWLGLKERRDKPDTYQWPDGQPVTYLNWHPGQPSNMKGLDENVVIMNFGWKQYKKLERAEGWADGDWYDVSGAFNKPSPLCERAPVVDPESSYCADGWHENAGSCYQLLDWNTSHAKARAACKEDGADLVSIGSEEEQMFVRSLCGPRMCWLGLRQNVRSKAWDWTDGSSMVFGNWARGEPNNVGGREHCAMMNFDVGWMHGRAARWRRSAVRKKVVEVDEERLATKFRLVTMALFAVAYMTAYIVRYCLGVPVPGGPVAAISAMVVVVCAGRLLDSFLWTHSGLAMSLLLGVAAAEGLYIGGTRTGLCKPPSRARENDARSPSLAGVLE